MLALILVSIFSGTVAVTASNSYMCYQVNGTSRFAIRLVGSDPARGIVQLRDTTRYSPQDQNGWKSVLIQGWSTINAGVVCREMGYPKALAATATRQLGDRPSFWRVGPTVCDGSEPSLEQCQEEPEKDEFPEIVGPIYNAGVVCATSLQEDVQIRLLKGANTAQGLVQVGFRGKWGGVCDRVWDQHSADVVCRQLGFSGAHIATKGSAFGELQGLIWLEKVICRGEEKSLLDCNLSVWGEVNDTFCNHRTAAGVVCIADSANVERLRIVGNGKLPSVGRVEVGFNNSWGTICDTNWSLRDADVVCKKLGFSHAIAATHAATLGSGSGRIWADNVNCLGEEEGIIDCDHSPWGEISARCTHENDAGVVCFENLTDTDVRLVGGRYQDLGRVEIGLAGAWGTICDSNWDINAATVICRQLNFNRVLFATKGGVFSPGSGRIWLDKVRCNGLESNIAECQHPGWGVVDAACDHVHDAGVVCGFSQDEIEIRLIGGSHPSQGRVEIGFHDTWGTICSTGWDISDAKAICRQLGYSKALAAVLGGEFGQGDGRIWTADVDCKGEESNIIECNLPVFGDDHQCSHAMDAGAICGNENDDISVRLVKGSGPSNGIVEIGFNNSWGTICQNFWDSHAATVVCRMLGYDSGLPANNSIFGQGEGRVWLEGVKCNGEEQSLLDCDHIRWGSASNMCTGHDKDAGVMCLGGPRNVQMEIRLTGGADESQGIVELGFDGAWGTVCDDWWDKSDADVVCRQLGYKHTVLALGPSTFPLTKRRIWIDNVNCKGEERSLLDCDFLGWGITNCGYHQEAGVICSNSEPQVDIRLVGGVDNFQGRVEVGFNGTWGTICDDGWDFLDAEVVCRQLGHNGAIAATVGSSFGRGTGRIWVYNLECSGEEKNIIDCQGPRWGVIGRSCIYHSKDAGVVCRPRSNATSSFQIRLYQSAEDSEMVGRVLIGFNGAWGAICNLNWDINDANVVCRQLNFRSALEATADTKYGAWPGRVWLKEVDCNGKESSLLNCSNSGWGYATGCTSSRSRLAVASIVCTNDLSLEESVAVTLSPKMIAKSTGDEINIICSFSGPVNLMDHGSLWRLNGIDIASSNYSSLLLVYEAGNSSVLIFTKAVSYLSGVYSCELKGHPSIKRNTTVHIDKGCFSGMSRKISHIGQKYELKCSDYLSDFKESESAQLKWTCVDDLTWEVDISACSFAKEKSANILIFSLLLAPKIFQDEHHELQNAVLSKLEEYFSVALSDLSDPVFSMETGIVDTSRADFVLRGDEIAMLSEQSIQELQSIDLFISDRAASGRFIEIIHLTQADNCLCPSKYRIHEDIKATTIEICETPEYLASPCICDERKELCTCSVGFISNGSKCILDTDGDGIPDSAPDLCDGCCLSEIRHGIVWPHTSHGIEVEIPCTKLKYLEGNIRRRCQVNGIWSEVDMTGCTFSNLQDSAAIVILEIELLLSRESMLVQNSTFLKMVKTYFEEFQPNPPSVLGYFPITTESTLAALILGFSNLEETVLESAEMLPLHFLNSSIEIFKILNIYGYKVSDSCSCNKLIEGINNLQFTELCKGPPGPLPCQCSNSKCECNYPYKSLTTSEALCTLDSDGDGIPDSDDDDPITYNGNVIHPGCQVTSGTVCQSEAYQHITWTSTRPCMFNVRSCSDDLVFAEGLARRFCDGNGMWEEPVLDSCEVRLLKDFKRSISFLLDGIMTSPNVKANSTWMLHSDQVHLIVKQLRNIEKMNLLQFKNDLVNLFSLLETFVKISDISDLLLQSDISEDLLGAFNLMLDNKLAVMWKDLKLSELPSNFLQVTEYFMHLLTKASLASERTHYSGVHVMLAVKQNIVVQGTIIDPRKVSATSSVYFKGQPFPNGSNVEPPVIYVPEDVIIESSKSSSLNVSITTVQLNNMPQYMEILNNSNTSKLLFPFKGKWLPYMLMCQVNPSVLTSLPQPIEFTFKTPSDVTIQAAKCFYWSFLANNGLGSWSDELVETVIQERSVLCKSFHLSSFAVFAETIKKTSEGKPVDISLPISVYLGCSLSLLATIYCIIILCLRKELLKNLMTFINLNTMISLFIGLCVFIIGVLNATSSQVSCVLVSALIHYFFLCVFFWMLSEVVYIFSYIILKAKLSKKIWFVIFSIISWGAPAIVVALSVAAKHEIYRVPEVLNVESHAFYSYKLGACWLPSRDGLLAAFIAPVAFVILIALIGLCIVVGKLLFYSRKAEESTTVEMNRIRDGRFWTARVFAILPITALTWILALVAININLPYLAWLFLIAHIIQASTYAVVYTVMYRKMKHSQEHLRLESPTSNNEPENQEKESPSVIFHHHEADESAVDFKMSN